MKSKLLPAIAMPVALAFGAMTAVAQVAPPSPSEAPAAKAPADPTTPSPTATTPAPSSHAPGAFATNQTANEWRSSKLIGMTVYNKANEKVGEINDLIFSSDGKIADAIIGVGGFLGMGEKLVGVAFSDLQLVRDADGVMSVTINSTKEMLEGAPTFKYYAPSGKTN